MLTDKKILVIESEQYLFSPRVMGERFTVTVRQTNVMWVSEENRYIYNVNVPNMKLHVIQTKDVAYVVNVESFKDVNLSEMTVATRLSLLTEEYLKNLKLEAVKYYTFGEVVSWINEDMIYRHKFNDRDQGLFSVQELILYKKSILIIVAMEEVKKQSIILPPIISEPVLITINFNKECESKIFRTKHLNECSVQVALPPELFLVQREQERENLGKEKKNKKKN